MGEDLDLPEREAVRTAMQWSGGKNGGFSSAAASKLAVRTIPDGAYGYKKVNVADQQDDSKSLLNHIKHLAQLRIQYHELGTERCEFIETGNDAVLAHRFGAAQSGVLMLHNLSGKPQAVDFAVDTARYGHPEVVLGEGVFNLEAGRLEIELEPYGLRWIAATTPWKRS
jgi:maltose alpha-D-glucosyltransferase/alpha-amylase